MGLIEIPNGFVVMDRKSFPGVIDVEGERLRAFAGQAAFYARTRGDYWPHVPGILAASANRSPHDEGNAG